MESENNRIKRFLRKRYGYLKLGRYKHIDNDTALDLYEYVFYVNIGDQMSDAMKALAASVVTDVETGPGRGDADGDTLQLTILATRQLVASM